jgi:cytochrome P450
LVVVCIELNLRSDRTFIFAGHETSSTGLSWTFYLLAKHPEFQSRLRQEVCKAKADAEEAGLENISPDILTSLPFLDAVLVGICNPTVALF